MAARARKPKAKPTRQRYTEAEAAKLVDTYLKHLNAGRGKAMQWCNKVGIPPGTIHGFRRRLGYEW